MPLTILAIKFVLSLFVVILISEVEPQPQSVDLNAPGAFERLAASNPKHFREIVGIMDGLSQQPNFQVSRWIETNFRAKQVRHSPFLLTTFPAQSDLAFTLDNTHYYGRFSLDYGGARVFETRNR